MKGNAWLVFLTTAAMQCGVMAFAGWLIWINLTLEERAFVASLWVSYAGMPILALLFLLVLLGLGINLMFRWYITPLRAISEEIRLIAMSNPGHRLVTEGIRPELQELLSSLNLLAQYYQALQDDLEARIHDANDALEEEKNTLAALMAKLTQGVVVCNREGRILLYNQRAQSLLAGEATGLDGNIGWIGLGRSVYGVLNENLIVHALRHIDHRLGQGETGLMAPFIASRPGGRVLSVHLVPVLDKDKAPTGYILTLEDVTHRTETESRRGSLLESLTEGQRSSIAGIRAAIETIVEYPDMDQAQRNQFMSVIRDESIKLSQYLDQTVAEYGEDLKIQWPLEKILGSDLLAIVEHHLGDTVNIDVGISAPLEPLWLQVDSYAFVQAMAFFVERLVTDYGAKQPELKLQSQPPFACLEISWQGASLDMETLRSWGKQTLMSDQQGGALTLHDAIDRHGAAVWTQSEAESEHCSVRLLFPLAAEDERAVAESGSEAGQDHDYDFSLFHRTGHKAGLDDFPLADLHYTVIDTETTGLYPGDGDEIIAVGAVRIVSGRVLQREIFDSLVNPHRAISPASIEIHGISPEMLRGRPSIDEVLPKFHRFVEDTVIIGHNVAFDMRFLEMKEARTGIKFSNPILDTLLLAFVIHPNQEGQSLEAIAARFGVPVTGRHSALGDALTTAQVFLAMIPLLAEQGIRTLGQARVACENTGFAGIKY